MTSLAAGTDAEDDRVSAAAAEDEATSACGDGDEDES